MVFYEFGSEGTELEGQLAKMNATLRQLVRMPVIARQQGYVETIFGRRLYLPEINAGNFQRRQAAERTAINAPMQGSAAAVHIGASSAKPNIPQRPLGVHRTFYKVFCAQDAEKLRFRPAIFSTDAIWEPPGFS